MKRFNEAGTQPCIFADTSEDVRLAAVEYLERRLCTARWNADQVRPIGGKKAAEAEVIELCMVLRFFRKATIRPLAEGAT